MGNDWENDGSSRSFRVKKLNNKTDLLGEIHYVDQYGRNWNVVKKGNLWKCKMSDQTTWLNDNNLYQLFQQIDKQPPTQ